MKSLEIYDTTLRDGTQQEGISITAGDKLAISRLLDELGVAYVEGGWPGANPKDDEFFRRARTELDLTTATRVAFGSTRRAGRPASTDAQNKQAQGPAEPRPPCPTMCRVVLGGDHRPFPASKGSGDDAAFSGAAFQDIFLNANAEPRSGQQGRRPAAVAELDIGFERILPEKLMAKAALTKGHVADGGNQNQLRRGQERAFAHLGPHLDGKSGVQRLAAAVIGGHQAPAF